MTALRAAADLRTTLAQALGAGAAFLPDALDAAFRHRLHYEIQAGPFQQLPSETGPYRVREEADMFRITAANLDDYPVVDQLRNELVHAVHAHGPGSLGDWEPNDIAVMRYEPGSVGVSPHRDGKRNIHLIAILTTDGTASFRLCADRDGTLIEQWTTTPGSLVLMRSPAPDKPDDRPFHTVSGPIDRPRYSITYRMNTKLPAT